MKQYLMLLKLFFTNSRRSGTKMKKGLKIGIIALCAVAFIPLIALICFVIYSVAKSAEMMGVAREMCSTILSIGQAPVLIFGVVSMLSNMFTSKDAEFLEALPVKRTSLFLAKLTVVYVSELLVSVALLVPALITYGVALGQGVSYYVFGVIATLLLPMLPLLFVSILMFPLMYIVAFFKKRAAFTAIFTILAFAAVMAVYFLLVGSLPNTESEDINIVLTESFINFATRIDSILIPNSLASKAMFGADFTYFALCVLSVLVCLALSVVIVLPFYRKSVMAQVEASGSATGKAVALVKSSTVRSYVVKDFKELIRFPAFAFQSFSGMILTPLITVIMTMTMTSSVEGDIEFGRMMAIGMVSFYGLMFLCGMNYTSSAAFTREGSKFYYIKYLPVDVNVVMKAKLLFANIVSDVGAVLTSVLLLVTGAVDLVGVIVLTITFVLFASGMNMFAIKRDLKRPKLNWMNVNEAVKNNMYMAASMFIAMGFGFAFMIIGIVIGAMFPTGIIPSMGEISSELIFGAVSIITAGVFYVLQKNKYYDGAAELVDELEV